MPQRLDSIRHIVPRHPVVAHPFLQSFKQGAITRKQVAGWLEQQYYFLSSLPNAFAALYARIPDRFWKEKRQIHATIDVESWGSANDAAHSNTFRDVADYLGIDIEKLKHGEPKPYTKRYLDFRFGTCFHPARSLGEGLAAIALGNEVLNLYIYQAYKDGIPNIAGMEECPMEYFDVHLSDEESDFRVFASVFDALVTDDEEMQKAERTLTDLLDERIVFFDALSKDLGVSSTPNSIRSHLQIRPFS